MPGENHYRCTYRGRPYQGIIDSAELSLRFDYKWTEDMYLDVTITCLELEQRLDDGTAWHERPALQLDGLLLPATAPADGDFRKLDQLALEFHQPDDPDGGRLYELEAPGCLYFGQWQQIDDLSMRLHYLGNARFQITLSGTAEDDTFEIATVAHLVDARMLHRGTAAKAGDMGLEIEPAAIEAARKAGTRWLDVVQPSARALRAFARRLRPDDYVLATRVDSDDLNVDVIGRPHELLPAQDRPDHV